MSLPGASGLGNPIKGEMFTQNTFIFHMEHKVRCLTTYQFSLTLICSSWPRAPWTLSSPEMKRDFICNWEDHSSHDYNNDDKDDENNDDTNDDKDDDHAPQVWSAQCCPLPPPRELGQSRLSWCRLFAAKKYSIHVFNREGKVMQYWTTTKRIVTKISSHLVAE